MQDSQSRNLFVPIAVGVGVWIWIVLLIVSSGAA